MSLSIMTLLSLEVRTEASGAMQRDREPAQCCKRVGSGMDGRPQLPQYAIGREVWG